jgi:iron complex transport system substrate-binding protein
VGVSSAQAATLREWTSVLAFSPGSIPGEVPGMITDDLGRSVSIGEVNRIVSLHPAGDEVLFALDADDKLFGVSDAWLYWITTPEDVDSAIEARVNDDELTALNAFAAPETLAELIAELQPDVVFAFGYTLPAYAAYLEAQDIPVVVFAPNSVRDVLYDIELIGKIVGEEQAAAEMTTDLRDQVNAIVPKLINEPMPKVFCEISYIGPEMIYTTGEGSFLSNLIYLAGGEDIGTAVTSGNPVISGEYVAISNPGVIILGDAPWGITAASVAERTGWGNIQAVLIWQGDHTKGIYEASQETMDKIFRPGPRIVEALEELAQLIHPEVFATV